MPEELTLVLEGWNFQSHPHLGKGEGLEVESSAKGQRVNQSRLCNEASTQTQKDGIWRASALVNTWRFEKSRVLRENMKAPGPFPVLFLCIFHLAVPELYPFITNQ